MPPILFLKQAWVFIKKYWYIFLAIAGFALLGLWLRGNGVMDLAELLDKIRKRHDEELAAIQKANDEEQAKKAAAEQKLKDTLDHIQKQYEQSQQQLDEKKKKEIAKIVKETQDDPVELAKRLQESTGFNIVLPEE